MKSKLQLKFSVTGIELEADQAHIKSDKVGIFLHKGTQLLDVL